MQKRNIIVLANSRKKSNRCIAGIDVVSGEWIRPCFRNGENGIPPGIRQIDGKEPQLLDIIEIMVSKDGPHTDIQPENKSLIAVKWKKVGKASIADIIKYVKKTGPIFYNSDRKIHFDELQNIPLDKRYSLCLIKAKTEFSTGASPTGKKRVWAAFEFSGSTYDLTVTDFDFEEKTPSYSRFQKECLLTISLGLPYEQDNYCYKFVAGVIEL